MFWEGIKEYLISLWWFEHCWNSLKDGMYGPRLLKMGWVPRVGEACRAKSLGAAANLPLRVSTDGRRENLQGLSFLALKIDLVLEVTQTSKCLWERRWTFPFVLLAKKNASVQFRMSQLWHQRYLGWNDSLPWGPSRALTMCSSIPGLDPLDASISPLDPRLVIIRQLWPLRSSWFLIILPQSGIKHNSVLRQQGTKRIHKKYTCMYVYVYNISLYSPLQIANVSSPLPEPKFLKNQTVSL